MNNPYNFEKFVNVGSKLSNYSISVNKSKSLGLLSGLYSKEGIRNYDKAVLFFDKTQKAIAVHFTNEKNAEGAFKITHGKNGNSTGSISAHSFFIKNEIVQDRYFGKKIPKKIKDGRLGTLFVIDLMSK